jgi:hypothetical protein
MTAATAAILFLAGAGSSGARSALNPIQAENALPGTTSWLRYPGGAELYASEISAAPGDDLHLHVSANGNYRLVVYRLGWYGGTGARQMECVPGCDSDHAGHVQPAATGTNPVRANWPVTDVVPTAADWVSGYYLIEAVLTSGPNTGEAAVTWAILRQPATARPSDILVQVPVNTWQAYNHWGGQSLYDIPAPRGHEVTFDRPFGEQAQTPMWWEIQLVRFLEREGYDVSYQTDVDTDQNPASLLQHRLLIDAGHDEYWSTAMWNAWTAAQAAGTNMIFTGSNDAYWHIRYADNDRSIITYKTLNDPGASTLAEETGMFRQIGPGEACLMGTAHTYFVVQGHALDYTVTATGAADPWLAGTGLKAGDTIAGVVGREHDELHPWPAECAHPGLEVLFHYDPSSTGDQNGDAVKFTAPSGARVFSSGAQEFTWALDVWRPDNKLFTEIPVGADRSAQADPRVQKFMENVLADLTRPAAPMNVKAHVARHRVVVTLGKQIDPRFTGFTAYAKTRDGSWRRLCHGTVRCAAALPRGTGSFSVAAYGIDRWGARSIVPLYLIARR